MSAAFWFMVAVTGTAVMSFIAVAIWVEGRKKEREVQFRSETFQRLADAGDLEAAKGFLNDRDAADARLVRTKARIAGLVTAGSGLGLAVFLAGIAPESSAWMVGLIPTLVGAGLLVYSEVLARPK